MPDRVLVADYDGTLASEGRVLPATLRALARLRASGAAFVLVTGRELEELLEIFGDAPAVCDRIVAENGALLFRPATREVRMLASSANPRLVAALRMRKVEPLSVGRAIIATHGDNERIVRSVIRDLGLTLTIARNLDALMVLPRGVDKGLGTRAALRDMGLSAADAVGVGNAENDEPLFRACGVAAAVANALDRVKRRADFVTQAPEGDGVIEIVERLLAEELPTARSGSRGRAS